MEILCVIIVFAFILIGVFIISKMNSGTQEECGTSELKKSFDTTKKMYPIEQITEDYYEEIKHKLHVNYILWGGGLSNECCGKEHIVKLEGCETVNEGYYYRCKKCGKHYLCVWG